MEGNFDQDKIYRTIEGVFQEAEDYFATWKNYQAMWDIEKDSIFGVLGEDIAMWN